MVWGVVLYSASKIPARIVIDWVVSVIVYCGIYECIFLVDILWNGDCIGGIKASGVKEQKHFTVSYSNMRVACIIKLGSFHCDVESAGVIERMVAGPCACCGAIIGKR